MVHFYPAAMRIAVQARIPDMLVAKPQGLPVNELAQKSGLNARKLRKVLRALATRHVFREGKLISIYFELELAYALKSTCIYFHSSAGCVCQ